MTSVERVGEQSREQHHRYYGLFGSDPVNGDGFAELHTSIRELGQHAADVHTFLARTEFTSAADAGLAGAQRGDRTAFNDAAAIASAAAAAADGSANLNIRGAAEIAAYMEGEAAKLSVIPDKGSPDGIAQTLATIDSHQSKSLSTVEQLASTAQHLGQFAQMAGPGPTPAPVQLSQLSHGHSWESPAQASPTPAPVPLSQPFASPPTLEHSSPPASDEPLAPIQHLHDMDSQRSASSVAPPSPEQPESPTLPPENVDWAAADNRTPQETRRTKPHQR
ncbi:hypothetical protein [Mycobacterium sp.]|uniref:hypothetical protein n=1 Tax=Mycobacterium sp. TaxID=1785 RepID=UPI0025D5FB28|nr:hypothetical protein [Mycobacterium sp.]